MVHAPVEILVVVEEYVEDALLRIPQQPLQPDPPILLEVLPLIHHDGVVLRPQLVDGVQQHAGQKLVVVDPKVLRWQAAQSCLLDERLAETMKVEHGHALRHPLGQVLGQGQVEAGEEHIKPFVGQAAGLLRSQHGLA